MNISLTVALVDIPGIRWVTPGRCVYVYFPTLNPLRPWENHPFSMIPTSMLSRQRYSDQAGPEVVDAEKNHAVSVDSEVALDGKAFTNSGLTLFVRKDAGMTGYLKPHEGLLTLVEGPYLTNHTKAALQSDRLILIGGGIGISGLLPFLWCHPNIKLFSSVKATDRCLIDSLSVVLDDVHEKEIVVGQRLDIGALLKEEANLGWSKVAVIVCGPAGMCDTVRAVVSQLGKEKVGACSFELEVEAFSW